MNARRVGRSASLLVAGVSLAIALAGAVGSSGATYSDQQPGSIGGLIGPTASVATHPAELATQPTPQGSRVPHDAPSPILPSAAPGGPGPSPSPSTKATPSADPTATGAPANPTPTPTGGSTPSPTEEATPGPTTTLSPAPSGSQEPVISPTPDPSPAPSPSPTSSATGPPSPSPTPTP